ncbi:MAG: hypothetical protein NT175_05510 [Bacteroidetes bacterium]|nr:hypothetical protein [Bacteroidota bacterium]
MSKKETLIFHLVFLGLFIIAILLSEERLYADAGYYLSRVINARSFWIEHGRVVLAFSQIIPLAGVILHIPLKVIIIIYSLGHVLYFYILSLFTYYYLKNRYAIIALIVMQLAGITHGYFCPQFEMYYGVGLLVVFYALLQKIPLKKWELILLVILAILILTSHPVSILLLAFTILLDIIVKERGIKRLHIFLLILVIAGIVFKSLTMSDYEGEKINYLFSFNRHHHHLQIISLSYMAKLSIYLITYYWDLIMIFILSMIYLYFSKKSLQAALIVLFLSGYIILINITSDGLQTGRYMQQVYFPIVPILVIPFIFEVFRNTKGISHISSIVVIASIVIFRIIQIVEAGEVFGQRVAYIKGLAAYGRQMPGDKFFINENEDKNLTMPFGWSLPVESILYSSEKGRDFTVSLITQSDLNFRDNRMNLKPGQFIFQQWDICEVSYLNPNYFTLCNGLYRELEMIPINMTSFGKNLKLSFHYSRLYTFKTGEAVYLPVNIENLNSTPITGDLQKKIKIAYHWYKNKELIEWDGIRTPLKSYIIKKSEQDILVITPDQPGRYRLVIEMLIEDQAWFGNNVEREVEITQ